MDRADYPILSSQPTLWESIRPIWNAFHVLSAGRQRGYSSAQPLQLSEILAYAEFHDVDDPDDREDLLHYVQFLDGLFMQHLDEKSKSKK